VPEVACSRRRIGGASRGYSLGPMPGSALRRCCVRRCDGRHRSHADASTKVAVPCRVGHLLNSLSLHSAQPRPKRRSRLCSSWSHCCSPCKRSSPRPPRCRRCGRGWIDRSAHRDPEGAVALTQDNRARSGTGSCACGGSPGTGDVAPGPARDTGSLPSERGAIDGSLRHQNRR
jgi:hypothetical protein